LHGYFFKAKAVAADLSSYRKFSTLPHPTTQRERERKGERDRETLGERERQRLGEKRILSPAINCSQ